MSKVIMIVDDSLTVRADLEEAFTAEGLPTICCASAAQARATFGTQEIGLVVLDVLLPDGDGIDLLREFRATPAGADIPVLMLSSEAEVKDRIRGLLTGSSEYIGKPYDRDHVMARARELLGTKRPERKREQVGEKALVLVIDDSATFRERFGDLLREQGFDVLCAESGEEGLRSAAINRPAAIVIDGVLPGIDGPTVVRKLRLDAALRHTPCIMLTGSESFDAELRALDSGADAFVRKEEDLEMILARVTAVLRNVGKVEARHETVSLQGPKRILAVDDSLTYLHELNDTLNGEGYDVILAHSGEEALDMLAVQTVDCILLDRLMPGIDGTETCRRIKASATTRDIPLIMLTAMEDREAMIEGLSTGADDYVLKSSEMDVLKARVRAQLRRKQFEEESRRIRLELMSKELEATEARAARSLAESRAELLAVLERKNQDLETAVDLLRQGQQEIEERNQQLQEANRLKSEFVSNMSHEIRTPMNAILGFAYLLDQRQLDGDSADLVRKIRNAGRTLQSIINDILDFSKIEAGRLEIERAPLRINDIFDNLSDIMAANAGHKDLELVISPPPDIGGQLYGDALRIEQVLINLTGNAIKFSEHGAIRVGINLLEKTDKVATMRFSVTDSGIGIPVEQQSQIFAAFSQADASTTRRFGGTGLGLTICRHLVKNMGGEIGVVSEPGKGSEFWFTVPFEWSSMTEFAPPEMLTLDVLIVDDNEIALNNLRLIARSIGWNVTKAESGEIALQKIRAKHELNANYNVLLVDWKMPGMDGLTTALKMREEFSDEPTAIVLMVAAFSRDELLRQPDVDAVDGILCKPVTSSTLYNSVAEALRRIAGGLSKSEERNIKRIPGVRILIVDDSEINREVAMRIVTTDGAIVSLANNGKDALEWLCSSQNVVDIVLMDVQMPVMDGYEATRQLRSLPQFADLPIVALTAGAFKAQQDDALTAGMNAFVSKPFNVEELVTTIQRLTYCQPLLKGAAQRGSGTATDFGNLPGIEVEKGLSVWRDVAMYRKFLVKFCSDFADSSDLLDSYFASGNHETAQALLHKLKGAAGNMALFDVARLAAEVEAIELSTGLSDGLRQLRSALAIAFSSVAKFAAQAEEEATSDLVAANVKPLHQILPELLQALDSDAPDNANRLVASMKALLIPDFIAQLEARIDSFDFRGAEALVRRLIDNPQLGVRE
ncbi:response regulator [Solimicrobium silvestre]|uniref:Virulence sensor protein BvgS n=1 Tax=Solimicrobium silvestre TaxID=2099400 RepID=A0A2S9H5B0_9BURK|nr:response regulator [Solimicrobium silvestre]PRC95172.1 Histidine kinase-, DNA gyrase B-, and HSP90-like ATPase [Solimicrobium silvestre]